MAKQLMFYLFFCFIRHFWTDELYTRAMYTAENIKHMITFENSGVCKQN